MKRGQIVLNIKAWISNVEYRKYGKLGMIAGIVVAADQVTKAVVMNTIPLYHAVVVIPGFFNLTHIHNPGGAFGFLADQGPAIRNFMFLCVSVVAIGLVFHFYKNTPRSHPFLASAFALIFGGALGNLIDRLRFGKVVDFLDFYIGSLHWPAFNLADSAISIGVIIFALHLVLNKMPA